MDVKSFKGAAHIILVSAGAAIVALMIAQWFPSLIPVRATTVQL